jgi:hypothetical protein
MKSDVPYLKLIKESIDRIFEYRAGIVVKKIFMKIMKRKMPV